MTPRRALTALASIALRLAWIDEDRREQINDTYCLDLSLLLLEQRRNRHQSACILRPFL
jgi:hypothetical protein